MPFGNDSGRAYYKSHIQPVLSMSKSLPIDNALSVTSGGSLTIPSAE